MKVKHFLLPFTLSIFMLSVSGCSTVNKKQPESMPEVTLVTADKRGSRFNSTQVAAVMPQSGPTNPLELEASWTRILQTRWKASILWEPARTSN